MNLIGKIFIIFIVTMTITFAGFTSAVYVTHRNWRKVALEAADQLKKEQDAHKADVEDRDGKIVRLDEKLKRNEKYCTELESNNKKLDAALDAKNKTIAQHEETIRQAAATVQATEKNSANLAARVAALSEEKRKVEVESDTNFREKVRLQEELNAVRVEVARLQNSNLALAEKNALAMEALRHVNINPESDYKSQRPPTGFRGHISAVQGNEVVEIYGGSDQGLRKGHKLEVIRGGAGQGAEYIGRIEVVQTAFDKSVCRVMKEMLRKPMQRGDNVVSEIN
jgi:uncharacterized protein YhaN